MRFPGLIARMMSILLAELERARAVATFGDEGRAEYSDLGSEMSAVTMIWDGEKRDIGVEMWRGRGGKGWGIRLMSG